MTNPAFDALRAKNQVKINTTHKDLVKEITQLAYMKGYEKGIDFTELSVTNNNIDYLIYYFKDKLKAFREYVIEKLEIFNVSYPVYSKIQMYYELKGELKAIKEFSRLYLSIDLALILQGETI